MIKATVKYTVRHIRQMLWSGRNLIAMIFLYAVYAVNLVLTGLLLLAKIFGADVDMLFQIVFFAFFSAYLVYRTFFYENTVFKQHQHRFPNTVIYYSFGENSFITEESGDTHNARQEVGYDKLFKVVEKKEWFLMYITPTSVYVINKSEITEGTPDELRQFLKNKLGKKFRQ